MAGGITRTPKPTPSKPPPSRQPITRSSVPPSPLEDSSTTMADTDNEPRSSRSKSASLTFDDCIQAILSHPLVIAYPEGRPTKPILPLDLENNPVPAPKGPYFDPALYWKIEDGTVFSFVFLSEVVKSTGCVPRFGPYYNNTGTGYNQVRPHLSETLYYTLTPFP